MKADDLAVLVERTETARAAWAREDAAMAVTMLAQFCCENADTLIAALRAWEEHHDK